MIFAVRTTITVGVFALASAAYSFSVGYDPSSTTSSASFKPIPLEYSKIDLAQHLSPQIKKQNPAHAVTVSCLRGTEPPSSVC